MLGWISANIGTIIVCAILLAIVTAIIIYLVRSKRSGKKSCGCGYGCSGCTLKGTCHAGKGEDKK